MKKSIVMGVMAVLVGVIASPACADNIGYVDMEKIFNSYSETQKAKKKFEKEQEKLKKEFEKRQEKVEKAKEKGKDEEDIKELIEKMEEELKPKRESLFRLNQELQAKIRVDIKKAIAEVAKEYGIDVVLSEKLRDYDFVIHGGFDLTDFVIKKLN